MNYCRIILFLLGICLFGCQKKQQKVITYPLEIKDYVEKISSVGTLSAVNNNTIMAPTLQGASSTKVARLMPEGTIVNMGDTICVLESETLLGYYDRFVDELKTTQANLKKQEATGAAELSLLDAQLRENDLQISMAKMDSLQIRFAPPIQAKILKLEQEKRKIQEEKLSKKLIAQKKINEQSIRALKSQIIQKELRVKQFKDQLDMLNIIAPRSGLLVYAESPYARIIMASGGSTSFGGNLKLGSTVRRRQALFHLPDLDKMQVELMLQETDFKRVLKDQKVLIYPESIGQLTCTGKVSNISLVGERLDRESKIKSYKICVSIDSIDHRLLPGLSASCEIIFNHIQDTVIVPTMAIFEQDSSKIVYQIKGDLFEPIVVETGLSNPSESIISSGLIGNEIISLMKPPMKSIINPKKDIND